MRAVVAVDWSDQSFNAVKVVCRLFTQEELTLLHAVDFRPFENPLFAQPLGRRSAEELRQGMVAAGERLLRSNRLSSTFNGLLHQTSLPDREPGFSCAGDDSFVSHGHGCGWIKGGRTTRGVGIRQRLAPRGLARPLRGPAGQRRPGKHSTCPAGR